MIGQGVHVTNVTFNSAATALNIGSFIGGNTNIGLNAGIIMASGSVLNAVGPNSSTSMGNATNTGGDPQLAALIPGYTVNDAAVLEFDFIPLADTITFNYVFGSEEYPEYVNSSFNDVFGFFVSGPNPTGGNYTNQNIAIIPGTVLPVTINNVNNVTPSYPQYYIDNTGGATIQYDGFTTVLEAMLVVVPCQTYHIKLAVADAGDMILDSGVFLEEYSFSSNAVDVSIDYSLPSAGLRAIEGCNDAIISFDLQTPTPDSIWVTYQYSGTATNGIDFPAIPDSILIVPGQIHVDFIIAPVYDGVAEGTETFSLVVQTSPCTSETIIINIFDYYPKVMTTSNDTMICQGTASIWANGSGGAPPLIYNWTPSTGLNSSTIPNPSASPTTTTLYTIEVNDTTGCPSIFDSVKVEVNTAPSISFMSSTFSGCEPLTVDFSDFSTPAIATWLWDFGDGNTSTLQDPTHTYLNAGTYDITLTVTTINGCVDFYFIGNLITVHPQPVAAFYVNPEIVPLNHANIGFFDLSTNVTQWLWDFGDGSTSTVQNPSHTYSTLGYHQVWLYASTFYGCMDSIMHEVLIINDSLIFPNVITPNGDGFNDKFEITNLESYLSNNVVIYNRWGKKVFEATNYKNDWDGDNLPDGVYYFIVSYHGYLQDGTKEGSLTIIR